ncbi:MAG: hypothetical protein ABH829_05830 [archaeon]
MDKPELRESRNQLLDEKRKLIEETRSISDQMNALREEAAKLKKERDELNALVKDSKTERELANKKMKSIGMPNVDFGVYRGLDGTEALKKELEGLEWTYQTSSLTPEKDKKMAKKITELQELLKIAQERDSKRKEVREKMGTSENVRKEQKAFHMSVLRYAEESEKRHKKLMENYRKLDELKKRKGEISNSLDGLKGKVDGINDQLLSREEKEAIERRKEANRKMQDEVRIIAEKYKHVKMKLDNGGILTKDDFLILQRYEQHNEQKEA